MSTTTVVRMRMMTIMTRRMRRWRRRGTKHRISNEEDMESNSEDDKYKYPSKTAQTEAGHCHVNWNAHQFDIPLGTSHAIVPPGQIYTYRFKKR